jgi:hypothetical protein
MAPEGRVLDRARRLLEEPGRPAEILEGCWVGCRSTRLEDDDFELGVRGAQGISRCRTPSRPASLRVRCGGMATAPGDRCGGDPTARSVGRGHQVPGGHPTIRRIPVTRNLAGWLRGLLEILVDRVRCLAVERPGDSFVLNFAARSRGPRPSPRSAPPPSFRHPDAAAMSIRAGHGLAVTCFEAVRSGQAIPSLLQVPPPKIKNA